MEGLGAAGIDFNLETENLNGKEALETPEDKEKEQFPFNGIMVFGHLFSDNRSNLSWEAKARALAAYQLWKNKAAPIIILTGGRATEERFEDLPSNAELMKNFLLEKFKMPEGAIVLEDKPGSIKTVDNVGLAINALEQRGLKTDNFIAISTGFHLDRINKIMEKYKLQSKPVSAEEGLHDIAFEHAEKMKAKEIQKGISQEEIERRYKNRCQLYDRALERIKLKDDVYQQELKEEPVWLRQMNNWGFWGPLALSVRGDKLKEIVQTNRENVVLWLERHPEINISIEDIIEGNFDYRELVQKGREKEIE